MSPRAPFPPGEDAPKAVGVWVWIMGGLALVGVGLLASLTFSIDPATLHQIVEPALLLFISPWMIGAHLLTALFLIGGYLVMRRGRSDESGDARSTLRHQGVLLALLVAVFALGLSALGSYFGWGLYQVTVREAMTSMRTISRMRMQQIDKWLFERSIETGMLAASLAQIPLEEWKTNREVRGGVGLMLSEMLSHNQERQNVTLLSATGEKLAVLGEDLPVWNDKADPLVEDSARPNVRIDSRVGTEGGAPAATVSFTHPIVRASDRKTIGTLRLTIDPVPGLLVQTGAWPTHDRTGEVMVVTRRGDDQVSLTPSRFADPTRAARTAMRRPMEESTAPGAMAILHGEGMREGVDYRGQRVLSASTPVTGVPWHVIAKIDRDEALAPLGRKFLIMVIAILTAIMLAGLMVAFVWRGQRASFLAYSGQEDRERTEMRDYYRGLGAAHLSKAKMALQAATSGLLHANSPAEALQETCRALATAYQLVDIADHKGASRARAGQGWADELAVHGPMNEALRTGRPQVDRAFSVNPALAYWRDEAIARGFHAAASFPVWVDNAIVGTLTVYASLSGAFDDEEAPLLEAFARDLGFTIARLQRA